MKSKANKPILLTLALVICLSMLRLGFWQLDRAEQKRQLQQQAKTQAKQPAKSLDLIQKEEITQYQPVHLTGHYEEQGTVLIDNQMFNGQVGYRLLSPIKILSLDVYIMVDRGWLPATESRDKLPNYVTPKHQLSVSGRLNKLPAKPMLWQDDYIINDGSVWQFLPVEHYMAKTGLTILPMMLELSPELVNVGGYERQWIVMGDQRIAKHQAYALQWFSMALAFFIACLILLIRSFSTK